MKTIELNEQAVEWLREHLEGEMARDEERATVETWYSETSKGIMRHILAKLND